MQEGSDKERIKELSWRISVSSVVVSVFFVSFIAFYLSGFGLNSMILAVLCSVAAYLATRMSRPI
uniref:Uncharacterized protein n=1 Tax=Archaeoglobus fulgidus TaxID=2234 RepID=A0A7J2TGI6_ARCFL